MDIKASGQDLHQNQHVGRIKSSVNRFLIRCWKRTKVNGQKNHGEEGWEEDEEDQEERV